MSRFKEITSRGRESLTDDGLTVPVESSVNDFSTSSSLSATYCEGVLGADENASVVAKLSSLVNREDMEGLKKSQDFISNKLIKTTDRLKEFNQFSSKTLQNQQWKFEQHTK